MKRTAVNLWVGFLVTCASALMGAVLLVSGPASAAPVTTPAYGPVTAGTTVTPATTAPVVTPAAPVTAPSSVAFTGADLALMFTFGAVAIGVGGTLVLVSRRRRSDQLA